MSALFAASTAPGPFVPPAEVGVAVFSDDFESGDLTHTENGYSWGGGVNASVVSGAARNGSNGLRLTHPGRADGEDSVAQLDLSFGSDLQEVWVEVYVFIPSNYAHRVQSSSENNKFFQIWGGDRSSTDKLWVDLEMNEKEPDSTLRMVRDNDSGISLTVANDIASPGDFITDANRGAWNQLRVHAKVGTCDGTSPNNDGEIEAWWTGTKWFENLSVDLANCNAGVNVLQNMRLQGWSNSGYDEDTSFDFDDVKIYTTDPGW